MSSAKKVLLVAHDRGGVNLMAPLLARWREEGSLIEAAFLSTPIIQYEMASIARQGFSTGRRSLLRSAHEPLALSNIRPIQIVGTGDVFVGRTAWTFTDDDIEQMLVDGKWDLVLTGTSVLSTMEKTMWKSCRKLGIPCAALCDMWTEYRLRLTGSDGELLLDHLLVLDDRMEQEVRAAFDSPPRTRVIGSPYFAQLLHDRERIHGERQYIRFISEPIAALFPKAHIHEFHVADLVVQALVTAGLASALFLRPHPQDDSEGWRRFAYDYRAEGVRLDDEPSWACPITTRAAIGLSSMMLVELALAGIPVASFQPPEADHDYFCLHEEEFGISVVRNVADLANWIDTLPAPRIDPFFIERHESSIDRLTDLILRDRLLD